MNTGTTTYPTAKDTFPNIAPDDTLATNNVEHDLVHDQVYAAIRAVEDYLGIPSSGDVTSLDYIVRHHTHTGSDSSTVPSAFLSNKAGTTQGPGLTAGAVAFKDNDLHTWEGDSAGGWVFRNRWNSTAAIFRFYGGTGAAEVGRFSEYGLDLTMVGGTPSAGSGSAVGDKLSLYSTTYGLGVQSTRMVAWVPSGSAFAVRLKGASGDQSSGIEAITMFASGQLLITGQGTNTVNLVANAITGMTANIAEFQVAGVKQASIGPGGSIQAISADHYLGPYAYTTGTGVTRMHVNLNATQARFLAEGDSTTDRTIILQAKGNGTVRTSGATLEVFGVATAATLLYGNAVTGQTSPLMSMQVNAVEKFRMPADGSIQSMGPDSYLGGYALGTGVGVSRLHLVAPGGYGKIAVEGDAANEDFYVMTKGTGAFYWQNSTPATIASMTSAGNLAVAGSDHYLGRYAMGTGSFQRLHFWEDGVNTFIAAEGFTANIAMILRQKGTGAIQAQTSGGTTLLSISSIGQTTINVQSGTPNVALDIQYLGASKVQLWSDGGVVGVGGTNSFGAGATGGAGTFVALGSLGDANNAWLDARGSGANVGLILRSKGTGEIGLRSAASVIRLSDSAGTGVVRVRQMVPGTDPGAGYLANQEMSWFVDEAANKLQFRYRYASGTEKIGSVALV